MLRDYAAYAPLETLPPLVRKQRRLEAQIVRLTPLSEQDKALRKDIDALLVAAGIQKGDGVTCLGYDVVHMARVGTARLNQERLTLELAVAGLSADVIAAAIAAATETGEPSTWATVKPSKGSKVRTP